MTTPPAQPVPQAATVLLLRAAPDGGAPEIFTITRSTALDFSAGVSAFPGGRIDDADDLEPTLWDGTDLPAWGRLLGLEADEAGKVLAGVVRETFEETGILLARHHDGTPVAGKLLTTLPADTRERVERHELDFGGLLREHGLRPDVHGLRPLSRWITPEGAPRRYDTYFFAAALPEGQRPGTLSFEGIDSRWTTAAEALADFQAGRHRLMPPTWSQFRALLPARSVPEALVPAGALEAVQPTVVAGPPSQVIGFTDAATYAEELAAGWPPTGA
ncbi:NUDIX hydrolase [Cellulosimicrobium funkei]|nr:NUDIX hydrolase [Cellulosimicrobium funkei]